MIDKLAQPIDALVLLSEVLNFDFASKPMDEPFTDEEMANISGLQGLRDRVVLLSAARRTRRSRDFVHYSGRGTISEHPVFCGTPKEVADQMEEWFTDWPATASSSRPRTCRAPTRIRAPRGAGAAAARPVPPGVRGHDAAREPRAAESADR